MINLRLVTEGKNSPIMAILIEEHTEYPLIKGLSTNDLKDSTVSTFTFDDIDIHSNISIVEEIIRLAFSKRFGKLNAINLTVE